MAQEMLTSNLWRLSYQNDEEPSEDLAPPRVAKERVLLQSTKPPSSSKPELLSVRRPTSNIKLETTDNPLKFNFKVNKKEKPENLPFVCAECERTFAVKAGLNSHLCVGKPAEPFHCPHCPHIAISKRAYNVHIPNCTYFRNEMLLEKKKVLKSEASVTIDKNKGQIAQFVEQATDTDGRIDQERLKQQLEVYMTTIFDDFCDNPKVEPLFTRGKPRLAKEEKGERKRRAKKEKIQEKEKEEEEEEEVKVLNAAKAPVLPTFLQRKEQQQQQQQQQQRSSTPLVVTSTLNEAAATSIVKPPTKKLVFKLPPKKVQVQAAADPMDIDTSKKRKRLDDEEIKEKEESSYNSSDSESSSESSEGPIKRRRLDTSVTARAEERLLAVGQFMNRFMGGLSPVLEEEKAISDLKSLLKGYQAKIANEKRDLAALNVKPKEVARFLEELRGDIQELEASGMVIDEAIEDELGNDLVTRTNNAREKAQEIEATKHAIIKVQRDLTSAERTFHKKLAAEVQPLLIAAGVLEANVKTNVRLIRQWLASQSTANQQQQTKKGASNEAHSSSSSKGYVCMVCLDEDHKKFLCAPECGHIYCDDCMLRSHGTCPKCRAKYTTTIRVYPN